MDFFDSMNQTMGVVEKSRIEFFAVLSVSAVVNKSGFSK